MSSKQRELIQLLRQSDGPQTAKALAKCLNLSVRTVRTYVSQINQTENITIHSGKSGYSISKGCRVNVPVREAAVPQTHEERAGFIIKRLLIERYYVDVYELAEELCVSDVTCRSDVNRMNKTYGSFGLRFSVQHDYPQIIGAERDKRRLIRHIINREVNGCFFSLSMLKELFDQVDVLVIYDSINRIFARNQYSSNDFAKRNLVLNLAIIISRIQSGQFLCEEPEACQEYTDKSTQEYQIAQELIEDVEKLFSVIIDGQEIQNLYFLIRANSDAIFDHSFGREALERYIGSHICHFVDQVVKAIKKHYHIHLDNEEFYSRFCMHVKRLLLRAKDKSQIKNPIADNIRNTYPLLYDMAVYTASMFYSRFQVELNEDETSFLAIHFGGEIERQKPSRTAVKAILFCPEYLDIQKNLYHRILSELGNKAEIIKSVSNEEELSEEEELVISTVPLERHLSCPVCQISLFLTTADKTALFYGIEAILAERKQRFLKADFDSYFKRELFFAASDICEKNQCLEFMCNELYHHQYVDRDFLTKVKYRESLASTAFGSLAIPHAMEPEAFKTGICVLISKTGIDWSGKNVNVVLMVVVAQQEESGFGSVYEAVVENFSGVAFLNAIREVRDFDKFRALLKGE